jgi:nicotinamidase-related amidase
MALLREGNRSALVIVDMQAGVLRDAWDASRVTANVACVVERARADGAPVVWVQHSSDDLAHGSADWQFAAPLMPADGEPIVAKRFESAFEQTTFEAVLADAGATRIVLAGAATNWCIRATAYAALDRGYDLTLVQDAHTTESFESPDGATIAASGVVADLNLAMRWLRYPGRVNDVAAARDVTFAQVR